LDFDHHKAQNLHILHSDRESCLSAVHYLKICYLTSIASGRHFRFDFDQF
jgi:hypothetical protein